NFSCRWRVNSFQIIFIREERSVSTTPGSARGYRNSTIEFYFRIVGANNYVVTGINNRRRRNGDGHHIGYRSTVSVAGGGEGQLNRAIGYFSGSWSVNCIQRVGIWIEAAVSTTPGSAAGNGYRTI